ncbi:fatty acyl-AMP ligase [Stappia sp.]|uniref:fatty acyl-AMP ligase n=1 Tax=Stappia sp. TaxID=1870903 RepID=UPI003A9A5FCA
MLDKRHELSAPAVPTLWGLLDGFAAARPNERAFLYLGPDNVEQEALTYAELLRLARVYGQRLRQHSKPGDRVILMFPSGLAFVVAFFACHFAGVVPVPMVPLKGQRLRNTVHAIAENCAASVVLSNVEQAELVHAQLSPLPSYRDATYIAVDLDDASPAPTADAHEASPQELAFIQYTSGSTSVPRGVMVSHANLAANLEMMAEAFGNDDTPTYVGWAPLYHDMGLIANVLEPFYLGSFCILMSPNLFAHRPWLWPKAISDYRAVVSGGPNYAYDLCIERRDQILEAGYDLSSWKLAFNSAEPVRAGTLERFTKTFEPIGFRPRTFYPCFGMAEATLLITGGSRQEEPIVRSVSRSGLAKGSASLPVDEKDETLAVGCGRALRDETLRIVDPETSVALPDGEVGEIWVAGPHIPEGYWGHAQASKDTFHAKIAGEPDQRFLRTGDLGFILENELYVTGRHKDLIIVRGHNVYPQDIEYMAERAWPGLKKNSGAAFAVEDPETGIQTLVLAQEVMMGNRQAIDIDAATKAIRQEILKEADVTVHKIVLLDPGSIPKTSSGKIRRAETRTRYLEETLSILARRSPATATAAGSD